LEGRNPRYAIFTQNATRITRASQP
jgi:hypothetical protein